MLAHTQVLHTEIETTKQANRLSTLKNNVNKILLWTNIVDVNNFNKQFV